MVSIVFTSNPKNYSVINFKKKSTNRNKRVDRLQKAIDDLFSECALNREKRNRRIEEGIRQFAERCAIQTVRETRSPLTIKGRVLGKALALVSLVKKKFDCQKPEESDAQKRVNILQEKLDV